MNKRTTRASKINSKNAEKYNKSAFAKENLGDYRGAFEDYCLAIRYANSNSIVAKAFFAIVYLGKGRNRGMLGDYAGAIKDFDRTIALCKANKNFPEAEAYFARGLAKAELGKKEEAIKDLIEAKELGVAEAYEAMQEML